MIKIEFFYKPVKEFLKPVVSVDETFSIKKTVEIILKTDTRRIPVVRGNELVGIITTTDILNAFLRGEDFNQFVSNIMIREVITCQVNNTLEEVLKIMKISRKGGLPVLEGKKLKGIITEKDFVRLLPFKPYGVKVSELMTKKPFFLRTNLSLLDTLKIMVNTGYRRFPVVENEEVVGIITNQDLLRYLWQNEFKLQALDEEMKKVMSKNVYSVQVNADLGEVLKLMREMDIGGLVVLDGKQLVGIITERDILNWIG
jgi:CBS domain-containing protein